LEELATLRLENAALRTENAALRAETARRLEGDDAVVLHVRVHRVHRCAEAAVLTDEVVLRDPTGTAAEASDADADAALDQEVQ
jgi:hypothetical protein